MSILVLGTVALDTVKTPFGLKNKILGGSAVHFSMAARLFTDVHLVAVIGEDFPRKHIDFLNDKGIVLDSLIQAEGKTFAWAGEYQGDLNSAITKETQLGVLATFCPKITEKQKNIKNVFLANVDPDIQMSVLKMLNRPKLVGLDSMNYWINTKRKSLIKLFKLVDIFVANDQEARSLTGETNLIKAAKGLKKLGAKMALIKKGEHGVIFSWDNNLVCMPAYPIDKVVDPTGAGDTFAGGFMGYLSKANKMDANTIKKAICYGTMTASFNVEAFGVESTQEITMEKIDNRMTEFKKLFVF